jgi:glycosyltransferase involved in cell wall biosynthesis
MSSKYPTLTCYCSVFKGGQFIKGYMEDMLRQTIFKEVQFFILDCASPDNEAEIISPYAKQHPNIIHKRLDKDPGLYSAWNFCIQNTDGDFLTNWNVDDRKTPWSLEIMRDSLVLNSDIDLVYGNTIVSSAPNEVWPHVTTKNAYICNETNSWKDLLLNNNPHCMPMWRRSIHDRSGYFDEDYLTSSDADLWLKAAKSGSRMKKIDDIVGIYYYNPTGRSSNPETLKKMEHEVNEMRRKYEPNYKSPHEIGTILPRPT